MAEPNRVYDDRDEQPVTRPDLRAREGIHTNTAGHGEAGATDKTGQSEPGSGDTTNSTGSTSTSSGGTTDSAGGLYNPGSKGSSNNSLGSSGLANAESKPGFPGQQFGFGYNPTDALSGMGALKLFLSKNRRKALLGGGIGGAIIGLIVGAFLILIPLKIEHIVQNLENRFFATSESAVSDETHIMFTNYIKSQIGPAMKRGDCAKQGRIIISKNCNFNVTGNSNNPVVNLYKSWKQAKLEDKLADQYGIELRYDKGGRGTFYLKTPDDKGQTKVGSGVTGIDSSFDRADRGTVRQAFKNAEGGMTSWKKVMFRYKVGSLLEEKYGIKRCIVFCGTRDALADKSSDKKYAAKLFLVERVITPRSAALGTVINCLLVSNGCDQKQSQTTCTGTTCDELAGQPQTEADSDVAQAIGAASSGFGSETADSLVKHISGIRDAGGLQNYVLDKVFTKVFSKDIAASSVPIIGQLQTLSTISNFVRTASNAPQTLRKLSYLTNAAASVSLYQMYNTYASEIHTGHVDPTELGSFTKALGPGKQCVPSLEGPCGSQAGGTATAESTPLYGNLMGKGLATPTPAASLLGSLVPSKASAATPTDTSVVSNNYKCSNHGSVPTGQLVCPEEKLGDQHNAAFDAISSFLQSSGLLSLANAYHAFTSLPVIHLLFTITSDVGSWVSSGLESVFESLPGVGSLINQAKSETSKLFTFLASQLIPSPFSNNMSGGRTFDMMAAGADVSGNDYAHTGLGGKEVSATVAAQVASTQADEAQQQFSHQSFFARMFSTDSQYSLVSQIAMDMPFSFQSSAENSFSSILSNPFGTLTQGFGSIFTGKANAGTISGVVNGQDTFGVTQYMPQTVNAPENYWDHNCSDNASQAYQKNNNWNDSAANYDTSNPNDASGTPINTTANPCLVIKATAGSAGGIFDTSNLTAADLADQNGPSGGGGGGPTPGPGSYQNPFHSESGLTSSRIDEGADFASTKPVPIYAIGNGTVTKVAAGNSTFYPKLPNWITYKLSDGPASGKYIYVAEDCSPLVHEGDKVTSNTHLCDVQPRSIETGWAMDATSQAAAAYGNYTELSSGQSYATSYGQNFYELLQSLGLKTKDCYDFPGAQLTGPLPAGWPTWVTNPATKAGSNHC